MTVNGSIVPAGTAIQTFRDAGYKNTASALAELIDNSIEAEATDIRVITSEQEEMGRQRLIKKVHEIMIYDNGVGMDADALGMCLQFGNGTRLASRKGIGRFGIGLPNASISQCKRVEVYSWQQGKCYMTYLDIDEVVKEKQQTVNDVVESSLPADFSKYIGKKVGESGTLIVWQKCDRLDFSRSRTLFTRMDKELCRVYRHFLDTDDSYGSKRDICLLEISDPENVFTLKANDPLYIMTPNSVPNHETQATNVLHGDVIKIDVPYNQRGETAPVEVRFSVALPAIQKLGGNSDLGKHYLHNTGVSFVRAAREIDFASFGFFNSLDERHRWWGCEIRFEPILDEVFGVTNNKQSVRGVSYLNLKEFKEDQPDDWEELISEDPKLYLRRELSQVIQNNVKQLMEVIISRGKGTRIGNGGGEDLIDKPSKIANETLKDSSVPTKSQKEGTNKSTDEKIDEWTKAIIDEDTSLSEVQASEIAKKKVDLKVEKSFSNWPGSQFFSVETTGATCNLVINRKHPFFNELYEPLLEEKDPRFVDALDLTMMAYARMQDELYDRIDDIEEINNVWGNHLKNFLKKLSSDA
jgi:hypothetical protein